MASFESGRLEILTVISKYPDLCPLFTSSCLGKLQAGPGTREWRRWRRSCRWGRWQGRCGGSPLAPSRPSGAPPPWRWWRWPWRSPPHKRFELDSVFSILCCFTMKREKRARTWASLLVQGYSIVLHSQDRHWNQHCDTGNTKKELSIRICIYVYIY